MTIGDARTDSSSSGTLKKFLYAAVPIVIAAALWFGLPYLLDSTTGIGAAPVGACVAQSEPGNLNSALELRDCADPAATLTVLAQVDGAKDCFSIAGSVHESTVDLPERRTCFGAKGADPNRSINTAAAGECLTANAIERTPCTAPDAATRILQRFDDVPKETAAAACDAVPGTEESVTTTFTEGTAVAGFGAGTKESPTAIVFCLAPVTAS
jgi:hypothetical protein